MFKAIFATLLLIISCLLSSCSLSLVALPTYVSANQGYQFSYPQGWVKVKVRNPSPGVDVVFRDFIEPTENLSVIISEIPKNKSLTDLGTPTEVGYRFFKDINNQPNLNRKLEFIKAESLLKSDNDYYILEYQVTLENNKQRHNLASVVIKNGKLFTFNVSTTQTRWEKVGQLLENIVKSFTV
jgi:photosystem II oxygen-evolving enhancer protein 2